MAKTIKKTTVDETVNDINETVNNTDEILSTNVEKISTQEIKREKKKYEQTDAIPCTSIVCGELGMIGIKTGVNYTWAGRGDVTEVEYQDLVAAIRSGKQHIFKPYFMILDEDFLKDFPQIQKIYDNMYSISDLREILTNTSVEQMINIINNLPEGAKESIKNISASMIQNGTLDSVRKIKALDEIFETDMHFMSEVFA